MVKTPGAGNEKISVFTVCSLTQCEKNEGYGRFQNLGGGNKKRSVLPFIL
jgi:hypothetical protein